MSCNVLIVDDSPILRAAIKKVVKLAGIGEDHIFEAGNGQEALNVLETVWTDLVLLDLNMPVMDGEQFAREVRKNPDLADVTIVVGNQDARHVCSLARPGRIKPSRPRRCQVAPSSAAHEI